MTVYELIQKLAEFPPDMRVICDCDEYQCDVGDLQRTDYKGEEVVMLNYPEAPVMTEAFREILNCDWHEHAPWYDGYRFPKEPPSEREIAYARDYMSAQNYLAWADQLRERYGIEVRR